MMFNYSFNAKEYCTVMAQCKLLMQLQGNMHDMAQYIY